VDIRVLIGWLTFPAVIILAAMFWKLAYLPGRCSWPVDSQDGQVAAVVGLAAVAGVGQQ
jgi:hypothetical protein